MVRSSHEELLSETLKKKTLQGVDHNIENNLCFFHGCCSKAVVLQKKCFYKNSQSSYIITRSGISLLKKALAGLLWTEKESSTGVLLGNLRYFQVQLFTIWTTAIYFSWSSIPAGIYLLKVNNRSTRTKCQICSKLAIKTPERHHWHRSGVFIVNFEHISRHEVRHLT